MSTVSKKRGPDNARVYERECYRVYANTDMQQGRGDDVDLAYFGSRIDADAFAKGKGVFGSPAKIDKRNVTIVVPVVDEDELWHMAWVAPKIVHFRQGEDEDPEDVKKRALSKLSEQEKLALGLK